MKNLFVRGKFGPKVHGKGVLHTIMYYLMSYQTAHMMQHFPIHCTHTAGRTFNTVSAIMYALLVQSWIGEG